MFLPSAPVEATTTNPELFLLYSKPKIGKTSLVAQLENSLLISLDKKGANYVKAYKMQANNVEEIFEIGGLIKKAGYPYQTVIIDTISALEEMCLPLAERLYSETGQGKNWFMPKVPNLARPANAKGQHPLMINPESGQGKYGTITDMPEGHGYRWTRDAFFKMIDYIQTLAPQIILLGHVKDIVLDKASGNVSAIDFDLTGKCKKILASRCDAIGYMHRGKNNQNLISFKTNDEQACGVRPQHLAGKEFVISQKDKVTGELTTHWDRVYLPVGAEVDASTDEESDTQDDTPVVLTASTTVPTPVPTPAATHAPTAPTPLPISGDEDEEIQRAPPIAA